MQRKILIAALVLLALAAALPNVSGSVSTTGSYSLPQKNLTIVEVYADGTELEKKIAEDVDLIFSREVKTAALFDATGIIGYRNTFTLNLRNVSGERLENISIIETIPKEIAESIETDEEGFEFVTLDGDPVIKFVIDAIEPGSTGVVSYRARVENNEQGGIETLFRVMNVPTALIPVSENDCAGLLCNDFRDCTEDFCSEGKCIYENKADGTMACGDGRACVEGECQKFMNADLLIMVSFVIIAIVLLSVALIYKQNNKGKVFWK